MSTGDNLSFLSICMGLTEGKGDYFKPGELKPGDVLKWPIKRDGVNYCRIISVEEYIEKSGISPYHRWGREAILFRRNFNVSSIDLGKYLYPDNVDGGFFLRGVFYICLELQNEAIGFATPISFRKKDRINPLEERKMISIGSKNYTSDISFLEKAAFEASRV